MATFTVRNVPEEIHQAIRVRASKNGRGPEAEIRQILEDVVMPEGRVRLGSLLQKIGREVALTEEEHQVFSGVRDKAL